MKFDIKLESRECTIFLTEKTPFSVHIDSNKKSLWCNKKEYIFHKNFDVESFVKKAKEEFSLVPFKSDKGILQFLSVDDNYPIAVFKERNQVIVEHPSISGYFMFGKHQDYDFIIKALEDAY